MLNPGSWPASRQATGRPFTVAVCASCVGEPEFDVLAELRATIRRCPHAVLATTGCLRGPLSCQANRHGRGVMIIVQPCTVDRTPDGPTLWIGPICNRTDLRTVRRWIEDGRWDLRTLPDWLNTLAHQRRQLHLN